MEQIQAQDRSPGQHQKVMGGGREWGEIRTQGHRKAARPHTAKVYNHLVLH